MKFNLSNNLERRKAELYFSKLCEDMKKIELKEIKNIRSLSQNAYFHVVVSLFGIEFGYTKEEAKTLLKRVNGLVYEKNNKQFLKRTRDMKSNELSDFIEWIRNYSSNQGCYIPTSKEYIENRFEIDKQIETNKAYL